MTFNDLLTNLYRTVSPREDNSKQNKVTPEYELMESTLDPDTNTKTTEPAKPCISNRQAVAAFILCVIALGILAVVFKPYKASQSTTAPVIPSAGPPPF